MAKVSKKVLSWRKKQKRGAIMKPSTFKKIEKEAKASGASDPKAVAGKAYWKTVKSKYGKKKGSKTKNQYGK